MPNTDRTNYSFECNTCAVTHTLHHVSGRVTLDCECGTSWRITATPYESNPYRFTTILRPK